MNNWPELQHPWFLFGLAILPLILLAFLYYMRQRRLAFKKLGDKHLVDMLLASYRRSSKTIRFILLFLATGLLVLTLANPRVPRGGNAVMRSGIDVMLALDVSRSMLAQDVQPNRLERAKQVMNKLIDGMQNDRVGIVIFAGRAYLQMPITSDLGAAKMYLASASPESVPAQGTVLGDAMKMSYSAFNAKDKKYKAVVLITDGEDHDEAAVEVSKKMASEGVVINTIGMGSPQGATIPDAVTGAPKTDKDGNIVVSRLNEELLRTLSENTHGIYQPFTSTDNVVNNIEKVLASMPQRVVRDNSLANFESLYRYLLAVVLLLLLAEMFVSERKKAKRNTVVKKLSMVGAMLVLGSAPVWAQKPNQLIQEGNALYKKGDYAAAANSYREALQAEPGNSTAQFNLAAALYKAKEKDGALQAYNTSIEQYTQKNDLARLSQAYYNRGVVYHNDNKLDECIADYKRALRINPNDDDARQNLQKALQKKKQEQQNQEQQNKNQNQQNKPKPQQSKLKQQDAIEKLKALQQQERELQERLHKNPSPSPNTPDKDW